jgi:ribonuclease BN (tRNA processing enzyme)
VEVRLLGSGGFLPTDQRETGCALLRKDGAALVIDAGSGARRLATDRGLLRDVDRLYVVLTHFHLDHTHGLFYLVAAGVPIEVWAAGEALEETASEELMGRLLGPPMAPSGFLTNFDFRELPVGEARIGPFQVRTRIQRLHANPTLALRIDDAIAWCTDTGYDEGNVEFVRGVRALFHDAFWDVPTPGHTTAGEAAQIAEAAGVERLVLIHLNRELADDEALLESTRARFAATEVGRDGWTLAT